MEARHTSRGPVPPQGSVIGADAQAAGGQLRIARAAAGAELLTSAHGTPVWPCVDAADEEQLAVTARVFGARLEPVDPVGVGAQLAGPGVVAGLGSNVEALAKLYAHLTQRRYVAVASAEEALGIANLKVVVHVSDAVPYEILAALRRRGQNCEVGVLWARSLESLRRQVLIRSAATALVVRVRGQAVLFNPRIGQVGPQQVGGIALRGAMDWAQEPSDSQETALFAVETHSDGIDAMLGGNATLCALKGRGAPESAEPLPRCVVTGVCHRCSMPLEEALASERLVSVDRLRGRVVLWGACSGVMAPKGSAADAWGILPRLLESPAVGCAIVAQGIIISNVRAMAPLVAKLSGGLSVSDAMADWRAGLAGSIHEMLSERLFIFGDPDVRANPTDTRAAKAIGSALGALVSVRAEHAEGGLIRRYLADVNPAKPEEARLVAECRIATDAYEVHLGADSSRRAHGQRASRLRRALLDVMSVRHWSLWTDAWISAARVSRPIRGRECACGESEVWAAIYHPGAPGSAPRYYSNCSACGAVDDRPEVDEASVSTTLDGLALSYLHPVRDWTGAHWSGPSAPVNGWTEWPREANGAPAQTCALVNTGVVGTTFRVAVIITGWRVSLFMRRAYVDAHGRSIAHRLELALPGAGRDH